MTLQKIGLAGKYAIAFLRVFGGNITLEMVSALGDLVVFGKKNVSSLALLQIAIFDARAKADLIKHICSKFGLNDLLRQLIDLLAQHGRLNIFITVIEQIIARFQEWYGIIEIACTSAQPLDNDAHDVIYRFIERMTGKQAKITFKINQDVIAGIRLQGHDILWEYSIAQQLRALTTAG